MSCADGWRPRLVALDVDGTLLEPEGTIQGPVLDAVSRAARAGAHIVLATGRSADETALVFAELALTAGYAVCSNGAATVMHPGMTILDTMTFDARDVVRLVLREMSSALVAVEEPGAGYGVTGYFPDGELLGSQRLRALEDMLERPVTRVVVRDVGDTVERFAERVAALGIRGVSYAVGYRAWLDLGPEGVSKATALAKLAATLGIEAADCLAIGDGRNDVEMLTWAGRGVAMGQAPEEVRAAADAVTGSVFAHGAATELDRWFGPGEERMPC